MLKKVSDAWGIEFPKMKNVKVHQILSDAQIITGDGLKILKINEDYLPFLSETEIIAFLIFIPILNIFFNFPMYFFIFIN